MSARRRRSWTYTFNAAGPGTYTVESRAVDDSLNLETPSDGVSYKVTPSSNLSLFSPTITPTLVNDTDPYAKQVGVELGMKFTSSASGEITGIRFYKGSSNTGTHLGDLWSSSGQLLASATFTNETASGWQQVNFTSPVAIQAGQTYYASYWSNSGYYSDTDYYFDNDRNHGITNGALTAMGTASTDSSATAAARCFPATVAFANGTNYWVDVVFNDTSSGPQAVNDSGFSTPENTAINIAASQLLANDTRHPRTLRSPSPRRSCWPTTRIPTGCHSR